MQIIRINNFDEFHEAIWHSEKGIYRGVKNADYELVPKVGRTNKKKGAQLLAEEKLILRSFKNYSVPASGLFLNSNAS